jgi:hypothetical protein
MAKGTEKPAPAGTATVQGTTKKPAPAPTGSKTK